MPTDKGFFPGGLKIKICGIKDEKNLEAVIANKADFVGFVFYPPSPRAVSFETARPLAEKAGERIKRVGLFVDPAPAEITPCLDFIDYIQLHGSESAEKIARIKDFSGKKIIKALPIRNKDFLKEATILASLVDWFLLDTPPEKPESGGDKSSGEACKSPGGAGIAFDWSLLKGITLPKPWMLAGGLNSHNIGQAQKILSPDGLDVSSGVEAERGLKSPEKIASFIRAARHC